MAVRVCPHLGPGALPTTGNERGLGTGSGRVTSDSMVAPSLLNSACRLITGTGPPQSERVLLQACMVRGRMQKTGARELPN
eukprot:366209-Chlamydomonas_euryale.AAC.19